MKTKVKQALSSFLLCVILNSCNGFKFLAPNPATLLIQRIALGSNLVIDCSTNEPLATTSLQFSPSQPHNWRTLDSSEYTKQGNVYTLKFYMKYTGHFRCEARKLKGNRSIFWPDTKVGLLVVPDKRPKLTVSPDYDKVIFIGGDFNFTCSTPLLSANLQWLKIDDRGKEYIYNDTLTRSVGDRKELILVITKASKRHSGFYKCSMKYYEGEQYKMASLKVYGTNAPTIIHHSGDVVVTGKAKITLKCGVDGFPKPLVQWFKENKEIAIPGCVAAVDQPECKGQEYSIKSESLTSTFVSSKLVIHKFTDNKLTVFSCRATNEFGSSIATIDVTPDIFRFLQAKPRNFRFKVVNFKSSVKFDCTTNDKLAQSFLFYKQSNTWKNITNSKHVKSVKKVFTISTFTMTTIGNYKCVAINASGYRIEWPNSNGMVVIPLIVRLPKLTVEPNYQQIISVGDNINFTCSSADGNLKWYREETRNKFRVVSGSMIYKSRRKGVGNTAVLMLKNAQVSDDGLYKCVLSYRGKEAFELASVKVFANKPPVIISYSGQSGPIDVKSGVRLKCVVEYNPKSSAQLTLQWYKEGKPISIPGCPVAMYLHVCNSKKYRFTISSLTSSRVQALLKIKHFDKRVDTGVYTCVASHQAYGSSMADMKVGY